jgi:hypothetical protein
LYSNGPEIEVSPGDQFQNEMLQSLRGKGLKRRRGEKGTGGKCSDFLLPVASVTLPRSYISPLIKSL